MKAMREEGATLQQIADAVGVSVGTAHAETADNFSEMKSSTAKGKDGKQRPMKYKPRVSLLTQTSEQLTKAMREVKLTAVVSDNRNSITPKNKST